MKKSLRPLGLSLYLALCYAVAYALLYFSFGTHKIAIITLVIATAAIFVAIVVNTLFHELGHLIFGLLTGYRFLSFRIFNLMLIRENGVLRFKKHAMPGTLGQCLMAPPAYQGGNFPFMLYNLGGILFGGIVSLALVIVALIVEMHMTLQFFCLMAGWIGLVLNFVNAIPQSGKKAMNDGTNTHYAKHSLAAKTALWNQLQYVSLHANGFRAKEMPDTLFSVPPAEELNNPLTVWQGLAAAERALELAHLVVHLHPERLEDARRRMASASLPDKPLDEVREVGRRAERPRYAFLHNRAVVYNSFVGNALNRYKYPIIFCIFNGFSAIRTYFKRLLLKA